MAFNFALKNFTGGNWKESGSVTQMNQKTVYDLMSDAGVDFNVGMKETYWKNDKGEFVVSGEWASIDLDKDRFIRGGFSENKKVLNFRAMFDGAFGQLYNGLTESGFVASNVAKGNDGDQIVIQMQLPATFEVKDRLHNMFLNLGASHDGTISYRVSNGITCIVCANTWKAVLAQDVMQSIKMVGDIESRIIKLASNIRYEIQALADESVKQSSYATMPITWDKVKSGLEILLPDTSVRASDGQPNARAKNERMTLFQDIEKTLTESNSSNLTIYDVLQGVTRYNTHSKNTAKNTKIDEETGKVIRLKGQPLRSQFDQMQYIESIGQSLYTNAESIFTSLAV